MKLTPELLAQATSGLNAVKERQLDLRGSSLCISLQYSKLTPTTGYKLPAIENLGVTKVRRTTPRLSMIHDSTPGSTRCHRSYRQCHRNPWKSAIAQASAYLITGEQSNIKHFYFHPPLCPQPHHSHSHQQQYHRDGRP